MRKAVSLSIDPAVAKDEAVELCTNTTGDKLHHAALELERNFRKWQGTTGDNIQVM